MFHHFSEQKRSGNFPLLYFNEKKAIQCHLLQKNIQFYQFRKKIHDELALHAEVGMDLPILTVDDELTLHKTFKANIPCNGTCNRSQLSDKLKQIGKQQ